MFLVFLIGVSLRTPHLLSRERDSNPRPSLYESAALPTELSRLKGAGLPAELHRL